MISIITQNKALDLVKNSKIISLRSGAEHRFIGIWHVVVSNRIFVRSWAVKKNGWFCAFKKTPQGSIRMGKKEFLIKTRRIRSESLNQKISKAYHEKYNTPGSIQYVKDLSKKKSVNTTTELILF